MTIRVIRFPEFRTNVTVYSGRLTRDELIGHFRELSPDDAAAADRWISYFGPTADLSMVDIAAVAEMKRITAAVTKKLWPGGTFASAIVSISCENEALLGVWAHSLSSDPQHPVAPNLFTTLKAACDWLKLSEEAQRAVAAAVEAEGAAPDSPPAS